MQTKRSKENLEEEEQNSTKNRRKLEGHTQPYCGLHD